MKFAGIWWGHALKNALSLVDHTLFLNASVIFAHFFYEAETPTKYLPTNLLEFLIAARRTLRIFTVGKKSSGKLGKPFLSRAIVYSLHDFLILALVISLAIWPLAI